MNETLLLLGMFLVTFGVRYPVLALVRVIQLPQTLQQALRYVPPAVLTAIVVPAVLIPAKNGIDLSRTNATLFASIISVLVAWRTKNLLLTIISGMGTLWLWRWLLVP
jgi:branched-subunit amino acid transport protein